MGFSRQEYWRGLPCLPPGDLLEPGIKLTSPASPALAAGIFTTEPPGKSLTQSLGRIKHYYFNYPKVSVLISSGIWNTAINLEVKIAMYTVIINNNKPYKMN